MATDGARGTVALEAKAICKQYRVGERWITVLDQVSLVVPAAEFLVIQGESGCGKSTLLSVLSGLDRPSSGQVFFEEQEITHLPEDALAPLRNSAIGFVFQSFHLIPSLTALENVMFPAELKHDGEAGRKAIALLERVGLLGRRDNFPHQLSGGEKQRIAICRALINQPRLLFADEPTGNLDSVNGEAILNLLLELHRERQTTLVLVTHSREIASLADRLLPMRDGRLHADP